MLRRVIEDLADRVHSDFGNVNASDFHVDWTSTRKKPFDAASKALHISRGTKEEDCFRKITDKSISLSFSNPNLNTNYLFRCNQLRVAVTCDGVEEEVYISLTLLDHLRPTLLKLKRLIKETGIRCLQEDMYDLDKLMAKVNPNRIESILLGNENEVKD